MAYITKAEVQEKTPKLKAIAAKYGAKITVKGSNSSSITVTVVNQGKLDFWTHANDHQRDWGIDINPYWFASYYTGETRNFLIEIFDVLKEGWYCNSDAMTDYFDTAWYNHVKIKPQVK